MKRESNIDCLKKVFTYGCAICTHLDIINYLNNIGISEDEYSKWGQNKEKI